MNRSAADSEVGVDDSERPDRPAETVAGWLLVLPSTPFVAAAIGAAGRGRLVLAVVLGLAAAAVLQALLVSARLRSSVVSSVVSSVAATVRAGTALDNASKSAMSGLWGAVLRSYRSRWLRRAGRGLVAVVLLGAIAIPVYWAATHLLSDRGAPVVAVQGVDPTQSAALRGREWVAATSEEMSRLTIDNKPYTPFTGLSLGDFEGEFVNVSNRMRKSYEPPIASTEDPIDIWFFGGSTMFGFAMQRDDHTIPSEFARIAEEAGIPVRVRNYGTTAATNYSETVLLSLLLTAGERPDLVVFYDGINDTSLQLLNYFGGVGTPGEPGELGAFQVRDALFAAAGSGGGMPGKLTERPRIGRPDADEVVGDIIDSYSQGVELSEVLAAWYGFEVVHFWQPDLMSKTPLDPGEQALIEPLGFDDFRFQSMAELMRRVRLDLPPGVDDISSALDATSGPVLTDIVHTNEEGAQAVAKTMFDRLQGQLELLSGR